MSLLMWAARWTFQIVAWAAFLAVVADVEDVMPDDEDEEEP